MASKKTEPENFIKDKLKSLFRINKEKNAPVTFSRPPTKEFVFTPEILKDIGPESPANNRLKTIKEISDVVLKKKLEENAIEALWLSIHDLVLPPASSDNRHAALQFLQSLIEGQFQRLGILRGHFFNVIKDLVLPENLQERLSLFKLLSENGRNLLEFEDDAGPFLLGWMPDVVARGQLSEFLPLLLDTIKYNAAYIDEDVICGFVQQTCTIPDKSPSTDSKLCLDVLDAVICYSYLPSHCVSHFVGALCRMVNMPKYCEASWELMRKLLGTHLGHSSILTMCNVLQDWQEPIDYKLLRGAVFYIGMALWGFRKVTTLKHTPTSVLPSFLLVTSCGSPMVAYEVILSVQRLVKKYGKDLNHTTWDIVMDILQAVLKQSEVPGATPADPRMLVDLHDILTSTELLHEQRQFVGSVSRFFLIVEMCASTRPESSVVILIDHHASSIHPGKENWISSLYQLLDKYFRHETRTQIRLKALDVLSFVLSINKHMYEDELIHNVVLPHMCHIDNDTDCQVRRHAVEILLSLAQTCSAQSFLAIIGIVEKILNRPLVARIASPYPTSEIPEALLHSDESHLVDIKTSINLLSNLFKAKLFTHPPDLCLKLYDILVSHLSTHYTDPRSFVTNTACNIRKTIVECLLQLRSDHFHRIGFERTVDRPLKYSPYVTCRWEEPDHTPPSSPVSPGAAGAGALSFASTYLEYSRAFSLFIQCLENEKDWQVLKCVLENLPVLLQNKTLIMSGRHNMVDTLSSKLCAMVNDRHLGFPEKLIGVREKFTRSDFHAYVFPVLASMVTYHSYLDRNRQRELIKCLEFGMVSVCAKMCVNSLRLCTLEMQDVMMRLLPSVLLQLSKISATISMAIPVLAFLSSIVRLPKLYANFVEDEYMSVFAIALPYTNPFKFSHYTVSLAHHVIAIWFIRCRLPFRKGFVQFIQKGLKANVLQQFEENARLALQNQNEDSTDRHRSGSYSEAALRSRRRMQSGSAISRHDIQSPVDEKMAQFHQELTETCTDVMARYTFGNFAPIPHRSHMAEFLLAGGQSQTWLLGNKLVTITTSGGGVKVGNSGLCEKCQAAYQSSEKDVKGAQRRRHRSEVTFSRSSSIVEPLRPSSQDDMTVFARGSQDDMSLTLNAGQDVGVQTGSSLNEHSMLDSEPLESMILGMKGPDLRGPSLNLCNCWCTNWAEIYIRAPSGNLSWMMRVENREGMFSAHDSQVPDLSMLFASMNKKRKTEVSRHSRRIESGSIGEEEYETLYAQYFPAAYKGLVPTPVSASVDSRPASLGFSMTIDSDDSSIGQRSLEKHHVSEALLIPSTKDSMTHESSSGSLRRSSSSPSVMSGSSDTLSPRESISDVLQQGYKSSDSEIGDKPRSRSVDNSAETKDKKSLTPPTEYQSMLSRQLSPSPASSESSSTHDEVSELPVVRKHRGQTISVVPSASRVSPDTDVKANLSKEPTRVGINPSFVFLQLYHSAVLHAGNDVPLLLPSTESMDRAIMILDHIHPYETHKIGVVYVGPGQTRDEKAILSNQYGSERYARFVQSLGTLVRLKDCNTQRVYLGGLDTTKGSDGEFTYGWQDESTQLIFHIATLMPNKDSDPNCNAKKLHIGNDYVTVVYNDSGEDYKIGIITGQFNYVNIVVKPLDYESNAVTLQAKEDIAETLGHKDTKVISDSNLAILIRQISIHCNLASMVLQRQQSMPEDPFANHWLERLRKIRRIRSNLLVAGGQVRQDSQVSGKPQVDFTEYV